MSAPILVRNAADGGNIDAWDEARVRRQLVSILRKDGERELESVFHDWDASGNGTISRLELMRKVRRHVPKEREWYSGVRAAVAEAFHRVDVSGEGSISLEKLCNWLEVDDLSPLDAFGIEKTRVTAVLEKVYGSMKPVPTSNIVVKKRQPKKRVKPKPTQDVMPVTPRPASNKPPPLYYNRHARWMEEALVERAAARRESKASKDRALPSRDTAFYELCAFNRTGGRGTWTAPGLPSFRASSPLIAPSSGLSPPQPKPITQPPLLLFKAGYSPLRQALVSHRTHVQHSPREHSRGHGAIQDRYPSPDRQALHMIETNASRLRSPRTQSLCSPQASRIPLSPSPPMSRPRNTRVRFAESLADSPSHSA